MKNKIIKFNNILNSITRYAGIVLSFIVFISFIAILGGGVMQLFGFQYSSIKSLVIFFCVVAIFGFPLEIAVLSLSKTLLLFDQISSRLGMFIFLMLDTFSTMFIMSFVDYLMVTISASAISVFIISVIISFFSINDLKE